MYSIAVCVTSVENLKQLGTSDLLLALLLLASSDSLTESLRTVAVSVTLDLSYRCHGARVASM